jgi:hypothetical protein
MSNPPAQGSQGPLQQGQGQVQLLKADDLSKLRCLSEDQKQKYRPVVQNFWYMLQTKPSGSTEHTQARQKLQEWSQKLILQERQFRARQSQGQSSQPNQSAQQSQPTQQPASNQQSGDNQQSSSNQQPATQPTMQQPPARPEAQAPQPSGNGPSAAVVNQITQHVSQFPFRLPQNIVGTPDAEKTLQNMRQTYAAALMKQERLTAKLGPINAEIKRREQAGEPTQELINQRDVATKDYETAKRFLDDFRRKQNDMKNAGLPVYVPQRQQSQTPIQGQPQHAPQQPQQQQQQQQQQHPNQNPAIKQEPHIKVEGGLPAQPAQPFTNMQGNGPAQQPQQNMHIPNTSLSQQAPRPPPAAHSQQQMPQQQHQAPFTQPGHQPQRPQINPAQANAHASYQNNSPHPQSAASVGPGGHPVPLSHHAAVSAAQRTYSNPDGQRTATPMQANQGNFHPPGNREREQQNTSKMPIPRNLNTATPVPVAMGQSRPTLSGPTNGAPGSMGQPVINKFPPFQLEGEGDRVLSKRKLDELVRQVTGGSEDALTPEVEEVTLLSVLSQELCLTILQAMLQLADEFVDTVITSACKLSKLRESPNLEIRDLQLVLERNYNIRIPGYASDEVRTVRKIVPAAGWTQKMNAVQAAKVMGGKTDI